MPKRLHHSDCSIDSNTFNLMNWIEFVTFYVVERRLSLHHLMIKFWRNKLKYTKMLMWWHAVYQLTFNIILRWKGKMCSTLLEWFAYVLTVHVAMAEFRTIWPSKWHSLLIEILSISCGSIKRSIWNNSRALSMEKVGISPWKRRNIN